MLSSPLIVLLEVRPLQPRNEEFFTLFSKVGLNAAVLMKSVAALLTINQVIAVRGPHRTGAR